MRKTVLFGASGMGYVAHELIRNKYQIIGFCDNDQAKWGTRFKDLPVFSPEQIAGMADVQIIIASSHHVDILRQLNDMGVTNCSIFDCEHHIETSPSKNGEDRDIDDINLGEFFMGLDLAITIEDLAYMSGGSGILDYFFLKALMLKFKFANYLEIGTFMGESLAAVADVSEHCYSITLPDDTMESFFKNTLGKNNFSRYFSKAKDNVVHYCCDSGQFDFPSLRTKNIDLVFIDGDHSYKAISQDSRNVFGVIDTRSTIVVWHDFKSFDKTGRLSLRSETVDAVFDGTPEDFHPNVYGVDNNICGVFIPDKYLDQFSFVTEPGAIYSYQTSILPKKNTI